MKKSIKVTVYGAVQGVGFRAYVQKAAEEAGVEGSVQNRTDGTVLIYANGSSDALDELIDGIYSGPEAATVEEVAIEISPTVRNFRGVFRVI